MYESMLKISDTTRKHPRDMELPLLDVMRCAAANHEILLSEEDKLFESAPDLDGIRHLDTLCFHVEKNYMGRQILMMKKVT